MNFLEEFFLCNIKLKSFLGLDFSGYCQKLWQNTADITHVRIFIFPFLSYQPQMFHFWSWSRAKTQSYLYWNLTRRPIMPLWWHTPSGKVQTPSSTHANSLLRCSYHSPFMRPASVTSPLKNKSSKSYLLTLMKWKISNKFDHKQRPVARKHQDCIINLGGNYISHQARTSLSLTVIFKDAHKGRWHK